MLKHFRHPLLQGILEPMTKPSIKHKEDIPLRTFLSGSSENEINSSDM